MNGRSENSTRTLARKCHVCTQVARLYHLQHLDFTSDYL